MNQIMNLPDLTVRVSSPCASSGVKSFRSENFRFHPRAYVRGFSRRGINLLRTLANTIPLDVFGFIGSLLEEIIAPIPSPLVMTTAIRLRYLTILKSIA